jgi:hypothetical protein
MNPTPARNYKFKASDTFWKNFYALESRQKELARKAWAKFKVNPFDPALRSHKIQALSARAGEPIYAPEINGALRLVFCLCG